MKRERNFFLKAIFGSVFILMVCATAMASSSDHNAPKQQLTSIAECAVIAGSQSLDDEFVRG